jgi:hypothetical protein
MQSVRVYLPMAPLIHCFLGLKSKNLLFSIFYGKNIVFLEKQVFQISTYKIL